MYYQLGAFFWGEELANSTFGHFFSFDEVLMVTLSDEILNVLLEPVSVFRDIPDILVVLADLS